MERIDPDSRSRINPDPFPFLILVELGLPVIEVRKLDKRSNGDMEGNRRWLDSKGTLCIHVAVASFHTFYGIEWLALIVR